jgi:hypothetical protein
VSSLISLYFVSTYDETQISIEKTAERTGFGKAACLTSDVHSRKFIDELQLTTEETGDFNDMKLKNFSEGSQLQ